MTTRTATYRVGELKNGTRELYVAETQDVIARVESDLGPAMIGDMTEEQARRRFPEAFGDDCDEPATTTTAMVLGCEIQIDRSGVGHCWVDLPADHLYADIANEIAAEITDGVGEDCDCYVATDGQHYRW